MALKRCDQFVFNNIAKRINDDIITLKDWLEAFIELIKQNDKPYSTYDDRVEASILEQRKDLDEVYTTLYGPCPSLSGERISLLLSVVKI